MVELTDGGRLEYRAFPVYLTAHVVVSSVVNQRNGSLLMPIPELSTELATLLAPALPVLVAGTEIAAKAFIEEVGKDAWKKIKDCWEILRTPIEKIPSSKAELARIAAQSNVTYREKDLATLIAKAIPAEGSAARMQLAKFITNIGYMSGGHIGDNYEG